MIPETFDRPKLRAEIERDEGKTGKAYRDHLGNLTIGCGWNLDANPLPDFIVEQLTDIAIDRAIEVVSHLEPRWRELDPPRQRVLLNLAYQLGPVRFTTFRRFWECIREYLDGGTDDALDRAADELVRSKLYQQTPLRVSRHVAILRPVHN